LSEAWSPYTGPWDRARAAHLMRRAGFGGTVDALVKLTPAEAVASLAAVDEKFEAVMDSMAQTLLATGDPRKLSAWWLYRMIATPSPLRDKAALFWHGHFATSAAKVTAAALMYQQNRLLRRHALGRFDALVQEISRDPAMLLYLDSATNRKAHPNENYARELMELFCLGEGNYTEKDIREIARAFTGWEVRRDAFRFNAGRHDGGAKTFFGKTGAFGGEDAVRIVLEQPAAARFIAGKLVRFFVFDEPAPSEGLLEPLAEDLRQDWDVGRVVTRILVSNLFYESIGRKVRSPVEMAVGLLRALQGTTDTQALAGELDQLGHALFYPPNVKGWDGGRTWINTSTLVARANLVRGIVTHPKTRFRAAVKLPEDLLAVPVPESVRGKLDDVSLLGALPEFQLC
jgi:uncharacterized protein (DUF1800 family)